MSELDFLFCNPRPAPQFDPAESQRLIDEHIRRHGITRCPTAFAAVTLNAAAQPESQGILADRPAPKRTIRRTAKKNRTGRRFATWTPAKLMEVKRLREDEGLSWPKIGARLSVNGDSAQIAYTKLKNGGYDDLMGTTP